MKSAKTPYFTLPKTPQVWIVLALVGFCTICLLFAFFTVALFAIGILSVPKPKDPAEPNVVVEQPAERPKKAEAKPFVVSPGRHTDVEGIHLSIKQTVYNHRWAWGRAFVVELNIANHTDREVLYYRDWPHAITTRVMDDAKNAYAMMLAPNTRNDVRIDPGKNCTIHFFFEPPIPAAKEITINLAGDNIGRHRKTILLSIPREDFIDIDQTMPKRK